jgi:hypothetical protein
MRTSIVMEPRQVLRERLNSVDASCLRIVQIQESANLNHNQVRGTVSRSSLLVVLQHHPEGPQDLHKNLFPQLITHLSTCRDVNSV